MRAKTLITSLVDLALLVATSSPLCAQQPTIAAGQRIRVRSSDTDQPVVGTLVRADSESVWVLRERDTIAVARKWIRGVEISTGTYRSPVKGLGIGLVVGSAIGALVGALSYQPCESHGFGDCFLAPESRGQSAEIGTVFFGALGGSLGLLIGTLNKSDRWTSASVGTSAQIRIVPRRDGFGATLSFAR